MAQSSRINDSKIEAVTTEGCYPPISIEELWRRFNVSANQLSIALGRTSNIVGEYAEYLAKEHYQVCLVRASGESFGFKTANGDRYQVKSRKIKSSLTTQLNVFRSWEFDFLVVILFGEHGDVRIPSNAL